MKVQFVYGQMRVSRIIEMTQVPDPFERVRIVPLQTQQEMDFVVVERQWAVRDDEQMVIIVLATEGQS